MTVVLRTTCRTLAAILAKILSVRTSRPSTSWSRRSRGPSTWTMDWGQIILMTSKIMDKDNRSYHIDCLSKYLTFYKLLWIEGWSSCLLSKRSEWLQVQGARAWQDGRSLQQLDPRRLLRWRHRVVQGRLRACLSKRTYVICSRKRAWPVSIKV